MEILKNDKLIQIIKLVFVIIWMIIVFCFSNEAGEKSKNTSGRLTEKVVDIIASHTNADEKTKTEMKEKIEPITRKIAHYTLYTIGGILILNYINTYNITKSKKIIASTITGAAYAGTDELHQLFTDGRSASIIDIGIDTLGIITGVCIFLCLLKLISIIRKKEK